MLYCVIPGPQEPTLEQLNEIMEPLVEELQELYKGQCAVCEEGGKERNTIKGLTFHLAGVTMRVHGHPRTEQFLVNGMLLINTSDLPASRKLTGLRGVTSEDFMCTFCYQPFSSLVCEDCFIRESGPFYYFTL